MSVLKRIDSSSTIQKVQNIKEKKKHKSIHKDIVNHQLKTNNTFKSAYQALTINSEAVQHQKNEHVQKQKQKQSDSRTM